MHPSCAPDVNRAGFWEEETLALPWKVHRLLRTSWGLQLWGREARGGDWPGPWVPAREPLSGQWTVAPGARDLVFRDSSGLCLKICYGVKIAISVYGTRGAAGGSFMKCLEQSLCTQLSAM